MKLVELSFWDPDQAMAGDVRTYIAQSVFFDQDVALFIRGGR
ncbi:hypothetical protein [Stenotrophomonas sepilia]